MAEIKLILDYIQSKINWHFIDLVLVKTLQLGNDKVAKRLIGKGLKVANSCWPFGKASADGINAMSDVTE